MNRLFLVFAVIVAVTLLITFAPFFIAAAIIYFIFRKRRPVEVFQKSEDFDVKKTEGLSLDTEVVDVQWREVHHENA